MFDPITSELLAELEDGAKDSDYLTKKYNITDKTIQEKFFYLIKHGFVFEKEEQGKSFFIANEKRLSTMIENDQFDGAIDGLTKMDSYLN